MSITNIDDKIVASMQEQLNPPAVNDPVVANPTPPEPAVEASEPEQAPAETVPEAATAEPEKAAESSPIDEYGNPVEKPRVYTEDEVNKMIRDRLARGRHSDQQQPTQQQVQKAAENFNADPNSEQPWEEQLETFIEKTIEKRQTKLSQQQWQEQESAKQAEFETKFTTGMNKYQDFHQVLAGKNITDSMMLATRALDNPAAFIYGAAKLHPQELDRISRINDPYAQASEIGRLHERMVKTRNSVSNAPTPLATIKGDLPNKSSQQPNIDQRIREHEKQIIARRRG